MRNTVTLYLTDTNLLYILYENTSNK